jgi:hypothetical protein
LLANAAPAARNLSRHRGWFMPADNNAGVGADEYLRYASRKPAVAGPG